MAKRMTNFQNVEAIVKRRVRLVQTQTRCPFRMFSTYKSYKNVPLCFTIFSENIIIQTFQIF